MMRWMMILAPVLAVSACHQAPSDRLAAEAPVALPASADDELHADRVALPAYADDFTHYATRNRDAKMQVVKIYANDMALATADAAALADGSVLVMEVYQATLDGDGTPVADGDGRFVPGDLAAITVMEKQAGWGDDIPEAVRTGDWLYAAYGADGSRKTDSTKACFECHQPLGAEPDYLFSRDEMMAFAGS